MNAESRAEAVVTVRGEWQAEVPAELARVHLDLQARGSDRARVLTDVAARQDAVRTLLGRYGAAVERVETDALRVHVRHKDRAKPSEKVAGYVAEVRMRMVVVDFAVLGDLLLRVADQEEVRVDGPHWSLRPDSAVFRDARTGAVRHARAVAEEYAAAAGVRLTGLVEISDTGISTWTGEARAEAMEMMSVRGGPRPSVADQVSFDVHPVPQSVQASVTARFTVSQPDFA